MEIREKDLAWWKYSLEMSEQAFSAHVTQEHGGYPVAHCHTCKGWIGLIRTEQAEIQKMSGAIYSCVAEGK